MESVLNYLRRSKFYLQSSPLGSVSLATRYQHAMQWVQRNTLRNGLVCGAGIAVTNHEQRAYPEVTGYYIPTLWNWGQRGLAMEYVNWLLGIQNTDGSWSEPTLKVPYTFDTGQILKGLMTVRELVETRPAIVRGCDWILEQTDTSGRIRTPDTQLWGLPGGKQVPEAIHLYVLSPVIEAGRVFGIPEYLKVADRAIRYYLAQPDLTKFATLSHFHAYIIEALVDLGYPEIALSAMNDLHVAFGDSPVPAYADTKWLCSTGLFQYALICYKLRLINRGNFYFEAGCDLQNRSGGFFGGYGRGATYFPKDEISWAVKYFLDALYEKNRREIRAGF